MSQFFSISIEKCLSRKQCERATSYFKNGTTFPPYGEEIKQMVGAGQPFNPLMFFSDDGAEVVSELIKINILT